MRHTHHRLLPGLFIIMLVMSLSVSVPLTAQDSTPTQPALQVVDSVPLSGEELGLREPVSFYFDRALDCTTVEASASVSPDVMGEFTCDDASLTFTPGADYAQATAYNFTLDASLAAEDGGTLAEAYTLTLETLGYLRVTNTLPAADSTEVVTDTTLTVIFNRPVVPLTTLEEMENNPDPLTIEPTIEGEGEWLNTSIYTFTPDNLWAGGTVYSVTVDGGLTAIDGAMMAEPYRFSFTSIMPAVIETIPANTQTDVRLDASLQFRFNQPIDQASFEEHFFFSLEGVAPIPIDGTFTWSDDGSGVQYEPADLLALGTRYSYGFDGDVVYDVNQQVTMPFFEAFFTTVPAPAIISTYPADGENARPYGGIEINFASPMNPETLSEKIAISPEPPFEPEFYYRSWDNSYAVTFSPEPSTSYTVNIAPGMEDVYGNAITTPYSFSYTTMAYDPSLNLQVPNGPVGFYDAGRDQTEVFVTHRNVDQVDVELFAVDELVFLNILNNENYYSLANDYTPNADALVNRWTIPNVAPENVLRYDRLNLGAEPTNVGQAAFSCPDALPTRTKVGDRAVVTTEPDPLRARESAPGGEIVELLYRDYAFPIVGGPVCANGIVWWEIELRDDAGTAWVAEGLGDEYFFEVTDSAETSVITVTDATEDGRLLPGIYYLRVSSPEYRQAGYRDLQHLMVVGNTNLTMKASIDEIFVWATDIRSGGSLANIPIELYVNGTQYNGTTGPDGMAYFEVSRREDLYQPVVAFVNDGTHFGVGYSEFTDGIDPWQFNVNYTSYPNQYTAYLYTERNVYRPGQTVYYRGIVRQRDDVNYTVPQDIEIPLEIFNDEGTVIYNETVTLNAYGSFSGAFELAEDAGLGFYRINISIPVERRFNSEGAGTSFNVAEYRVPEFQVEVTPERDEIVQGDTLRAEVDASFFFGGPVPNSEVQYTVNTTDTYFTYTGQGRYSFVDIERDTGDRFVSDAGFDPFYGRQVATGSGTTSVDGKFLIEIPAELEEFNRSQRFAIEATITDSSGQAVSGRSIVTVHQANLYAGVAPASYVGTVGQEEAFDIIAVDWDSEAISDQTVTVEVVERRWSSVQELDQNTGRITYDYNVEEIPVADGTVTTDANGQAMFNFVPPNGGVYMATVRTTDDLGNEAVASTTMWVSSSDFVSWRIPNANRIELIADSTSYQVGDVAEILITSPFMGTAEALITIERDDVISAQRVTLNSNSYVHQLPISDDMIPNAMVSVFIVKGVDENNPVANFRMGLVNLNVDNSPRELQIELQPDGEFFGPRDTVNYTVTTTDYEGNPVQAEVGVYLVDLAVLSLGEPDTRSILDVFYGLQGLAVRTSSILTMNTDLLTQYTLDVIKGGGGGGGGGFGIMEIREEFVDTPYWNPTLETDENGIATFEVTLPDNLTTWRLDARGLTNPEDGKMLIGQTTQDIISTKPVLVRPVAPRFFIVGDAVQLGAVVNNNTPDELNVQVDLQSNGLTFTDADTLQTVTIPANSSARVNWDVVVEDVANVELIFMASANNGEYTDATRPQFGQGDDRLLPVYKYEAPETVGTGGVLRDAGERVEAIALPRRFDITQGNLTVNLQTSLAATTLDTLDYLENYRYQSTITTIDRLLTNAVTKRAMNEFGVEDDALRNDLDREVNIALQRLAAEQKAGGGWGWYVSAEPNALVTAYGIIALSEAQDAGYTIDPNMWFDAGNYLVDNFPTKVNQRSGLNTSEIFNRQAFAAYALVKAERADQARLSSLYENRELLSLYAKSMLALSFDPTDERVEVLRNDLFNSAIVSANGTHWEEDFPDRVNWNTDTRTTAMVLRALIALDPDNELLPGAVRWLIVVRDGDAWETTQETAWVVLGLTEWMLSTGELDASYTYSADLNGESLFDGQATRETATETQTLVVDVLDLLTDEANRLTLSRGEGDGALYYTAYLRAFLPVPEIPAVDRGIVVQRYYTLNGSDEPITSADVGDLVDVHLTIIAPNALNFLVVSDPLPAGAEGLDPNLSTTQQVGTGPGLESTSLTNDRDLTYGYGWWFFDDIDFRDESIVLSADYLPAGTYEYVYTMRPSVAGTFNVIPPTAEEFFFPEVFGRGEGSIFTIEP